MSLLEEFVFVCVVLCCVVLCCVVLCYVIFFQTKALSIFYWFCSTLLLGRVQFLVIRSEWTRNTAVNWLWRSWCLADTENTILPCSLSRWNPFNLC